MESALDFRKKWKVDDALKDLRDIAERTHSYAALDSFATVKGYIGILELDLRNAKKKLNGQGEKGWDSYSVQATS